MAADRSPDPLRALDEAALFPLAPESVRQQALDYVFLDGVEHPRAAGGVLSADVAGQQDVYHVRAVVRADAAGRPAVEAHCTCSARRQPCRHSLAVLYQWVRDPGRFVDVDAALRVLAGRPPADALNVLRAVATGERDLDGALAESVHQRSWDDPSPGEALESWETFRDAARSAGRWPQAALDLAQRIDAGRPEVAVRHLAWLLRLAAADLPADWLADRVRGLVSILGDAPPEAGPALADLALVDGVDGGALLAGAAASPGLAAVVEAHLEAVLWAAMESARLAGGEAAPASVRAARLLAAARRQRGGEAAEAAFWSVHPDVPGAGPAAARALAGAGRWDDAAEAWTRVLTAAPADEVRAVRRSLAEALEQAGRWEEALPHRLAVVEAWDARDGAAGWADFNALRQCARSAGRWQEVWPVMRERLAASAVPGAARALAEEGDAASAASVLGTWLGAPRPAAAWSDAVAALEALGATDPLAALRLTREALLILGGSGGARPDAETRGLLARRLDEAAGAAAASRSRGETWLRWRAEIAAACRDRAVRRVLDREA